MLGPSVSPDPETRRAENRALWTELSEAWQEGRDQGLADDSLARRMEHIGQAHGATPSSNLLHSLIAVDRSGCLLAIAVTGALDRIAEHLARHWGTRHAILLDNGGSVGWWSRSPGSTEAILLVAGANYRPQRTLFLEVRIDDFLNPLDHPALDPAPD